jgi:hypothetical protein
MPTCAGVKVKGGRCTAPPLPGQEWCYGHHPDYAEKRRRNAARSHKTRSASPEIGLIKARLVTLAEDVMEGNVDRANAAVSSQVYNVLLRAISVELKIKETGELEAQVEELRELVSRDNETQRRSTLSWGA